MNRIRNQSIENFLEELASKKPTPGGGAAAAVAGATGASLVEMVGNLTKGNSEAGKIARKAKTLGRELLRLADEDVEAFDAVMRAYKSRNKEDIKDALIKAANVPSRVAKLSIELIALAKIIGKIGNKNAISDAKTALYLAEAAKKGAEENVKINLSVLKRLRA